MTAYHLMKVDPNDPKQLCRAVTEIERSSLSTSIPFGAYGELVTVGAVTNHLVWPDGPTLNVPDQTTGVQMTFASTNAADDKDAGTGIRSLEIHYLDVNLDPQVEQVFLEGVTPVLTSATDIRFINAMHMQTYGSAKAAVGVITAKNATIIYGQIAAGAVRNANSARMVPNGYLLYISAMYGGGVSGTAAAKVIVRFFTTFLDQHDHTADGVMIPHAAVSAQDSSATISGVPSFPIPAGKICGFQCDTDKGATITAGFFGWLEPVT